MEGYSFSKNLEVKVVKNELGKVVEDLLQWEIYDWS